MEKKTESIKKQGSHGRISLLSAVLCVCLAMMLAVLVRMPPVFSVHRLEHTDSLIDKDGLPYFLSPDAYYHARMGEEIAQKGFFGSVPAATGTRTDGKTSEEKDLEASSEERMDMLSFAPEGHPAVHEDGMVRTAVAIYKVFNLLTGRSVSLHTVEYYLSCVFAALTAFVVFLMGRKLSSRTGGLFAAVFAVCAPAFAIRTAAGTYDTDMVQPFFTVLMIFLMLETICAARIWQSILAAFGAVAAAEAYVQCWGSNALAFVLIMFAGGGAALLFLLIVGRAERRISKKGLLQSPGLIGYGTALITAAVLLFTLHGSSLLGIMLTTFQRVERVAGGKDEALPDLFRTVSELQQIPIGPSAAMQWLWPGKYAAGTVIGGLGGILAVLLVPAGVGTIAARAIKEHRNDRADIQNKRHTGIRIPACLIMLVVWLLPCLYAVRLGGRFVQHLAIPAGILAGAAAGECFTHLSEILQRRRGGDEGDGTKAGLLSLAGPTAGVLFCLCAAFLSAYSAWENCGAVLPSSCDAQESAMDWIAQNAKSQDAIIASWWDQGFFYEYVSGHPVLWDGVTQDAPRAVLLGKALITDDKRQSRNLLLMLSGEGNTFYEDLRRKLGIRNTCNALYTAATLTREEAETYFREEWDLSAEEAEQSAARMYPAAPRETYLVLSTGMLMRLGYIEFYANWDFTGDQQVPIASTYDTHPSGFGEVDQDKDTKDPFSKYRQQETIWQLFFDRDGIYEDQACFERVYEAVDGIERVQVWRVVPIAM